MQTPIKGKNGRDSLKWNLIRAAKQPFFKKKKKKKWSLNVFLPGRRKNKKPLALDSALIVWHVLISFKKQSMIHIRPSKEFRWSRNHAEHRERAKLVFFSICNVPWLPLTLLPELVKMWRWTARLALKKGRNGNIEERQNHWYLQKRSTMQSDERTR